jgi:hypothetical protein
MPLCVFISSGGQAISFLRKHSLYSVYDYDHGKDLGYEVGIILSSFDLFSNITYLYFNLLKNLFNHAGHTQHICKNTMSWFSDGACYTYKLS